MRCRDFKIGTVVSVNAIGSEYFDVGIVTKVTSRNVEIWWIGVGLGYENQSDYSTFESYDIEGLKVICEP